jgi:short-subunit dehydrogenase
MNPRVALITGASSGIGRALAVEAVKRGYSVGLMARSAESLAETAALCSNQIKQLQYQFEPFKFIYIGMHIIYIYI